MKFLGDFMTESVEILERLANAQEPPLGRPALELIGDRFEGGKYDKTVLRQELDDMVTTFRGRGNVKQWRLEVLDKIDECFKAHFMAGDSATTWAFVPGNNQNLDAYTKYCADVDRI